MAGQIHSLINTIISTRSKGNPTIAITTRAKFILKGINPDKFSPTSQDDPEMLQKVKVLAMELGVPC